jgi:hypothetical protein
MAEAKNEKYQMTILFEFVIDVQTKKKLAA